MSSRARSTDSARDHSPITVALKSADLGAALARIGVVNDMIPPREDDRVAGRIGDRFTALLGERLASEDYMPSPASIVHVAKRSFATRPAALMNLQDRIVYEALVDPMRSKIDKFLVSTDVVLWPRGKASEKKWKEFAHAPLSGGGGYVVKADIAGFYESIDHRQLRATLIAAGIPIEQVKALEAFLHSVMARRKGLPQGIDTSDSLATLYLAEADSAIRRADLAFVRHGDDFRVSAGTFSEARRAVYVLESALRERGLLLNSSKLRVLRFDTYVGHLTDVRDAHAAWNERLAAARREAIQTAPSEQLEQVMTDAGVDVETQWDFFYHGTLDLESVLGALEERLPPPMVQVLEEMFKEAMKRQPGNPEALSPEIWHARFAYCLLRLAGEKSMVPLPYLGDVLVRRPEETRWVSNYLLSIAGVNPEGVAATVQYALRISGFVLGWQRAWLYRVLTYVSDHVAAEALDTARQILADEGQEWLVRIEAARLLSTRSLLSGADLNRLYAVAPLCFRTDLFAIAARSVDQKWAASFLDGARQDALAAVVIDCVKAQQAHVVSTIPP